MSFPTRVKVDQAPILGFVLTASLTGVKPGVGVKLVASASWADPNRPEVDVCAANTEICVGTIRGSMDPLMNTLYASGDVVQVALFSAFIHEVRAGNAAITAGSRVCATTSGLFVTAPAFLAAGTNGLCNSPGIAIDDCAANGAFGLLEMPVTYPC